MNYRVHIKLIDKLMNLSNKINSLRIENSIIYRNLYYDLENQLVFSKEDKIINFDEILIIRDPLNLDIDDKKILNSFYKIIEKELDDNNKKDLEEIYDKIVKLVNKLTYDFDFNMKYDDSIQISKLLSLIHLEFDTNNDSYLERIISYINIVREITKFKIIIVFGLSNVLTSKEIQMLNCELSKFDISIMDISVSSINNIDSLIIDEDYCIL